MAGHVDIVIAVALGEPGLKQRAYLTQPDMSKFS